MRQLREYASSEMNHSRIISSLLAVVTALTLLWLVFVLYMQGQALWATITLVLGTVSIYVYVSADTQNIRAWRYLLPGVIAMLAFVAFPLLYTMQIGFTNFSSNHLLSLERAREYLLAQAEVDEEKAVPFTLHADGDSLRVALRTQNAAQPIYVTPPLTANSVEANAAAPLPMQPTPSVLTAALPIRDVIMRRDMLMKLKLRLPDGRVLAYAGLREFAPYAPLFEANNDGSLTMLASGKRFAANTTSGYFEDEAQQRLQPGFTVNVGIANYSRMFTDPDFRGPFVSIFFWTVAFAALTVVFSTAVGLTLAVALNWEALRFRTLYRTLLFLPYAVPGFISILVFKGLFNQNFGEINAILDALFGIKPAWFADPTLAKVMLLMVNTWLGYPYIMVLCTGLIKSIPSDLYEASAIAGARPWANLVHITLPLIIKPLTPLLISAFAFNFNNFVLISLLTDGRPDFLNTKLPAGTTDILVSYTYRIAFTDSGQNFGLAAAISTLIFMLVAVLSLVNLKVTQPSTNSSRQKG